MSAILALHVGFLSDPRQFARCLSEVPEARRKKVLRLHQPEAQRRSLGAGWLLEQAVRFYFGADCPPVIAAPNGKPIFKDRPDWHFSLSHTGEWALCGLDSQPVGVDAEEVHQDGQRISRRFFAPEETAYLSALPPEQRQIAFARLWTRKESYIKYTGEGLSKGLPSFRVPSGNGWKTDRPEACYCVERSCWFTGYVLPDGTPVTLCTAHSLTPPEIRIWRTKNL